MTGVSGIFEIPLAKYESQTHVEASVKNWMMVSKHWNDNLHIKNRVVYMKLLPGLPEGISQL